MTSPFEHYVADPFLEHEWIAAAFTSEVDEQDVLGVEVLGERIALWRTGDRIRATRDLCPHRGARLSLGRVRDDCLECPYHAWRFDAAGACVAIPTHPDLKIPERARVQTFEAVEHLGLVWVCLGTPRTALPPPARWFDRDDMRVHAAGPYTFRATATRAMENFFDFAHLPIVHDGLLATSHAPRIAPYEVTRDDDGLHVRKMGLTAPSFQGSGSERAVAYSYDVWHPLTVQLFSDNEEGPEASVWFTVTPVDRETSIGRIWLINNLADVSVADNIAFEDMILGQDVPIVESQYPRDIPLGYDDLELTMPSDRLSMAYRKWLAELGMRLGVRA